MNMPRQLGFVSALVFSLTAAVGVWAAYDRPAAQRKLFLILLGLILALGFAWLRANRLETIYTAIGLGSCLAVASLGLSFLLLHSASGPTANGLVILLPLTMGTALRTSRQRFWFSAPLASGTLVLGIMGLVLTGERTPWLALLVGLLSAGMMHYWLMLNQSGPLRWVCRVVLASLAVSVLGYVAVLGMSASRSMLLGLRLAPVASRLLLWHDSLALIQDYPFTGSGLGSTAMVFSSYVFLLHVPFQNQAHNLFLQIANEQGVPGLLAFLGMGIASGWSLLQARRSRSAPVRQAATVTSAALIASLVYGMFDSEVYTSGLVPILFIPLGCAWFLGTAGSRDFPIRPAARRKFAVSATILVLLGCGGFLLQSGVRAQFQANLGAVSQAQAELSIYRWPRWGLQDDLRRSRVGDLWKAINAYGTALSIDPLNVTSNRRLGQIELAQGDIRSAQRHLEIAYRCAPEQRATRQLLGEIYAISGKSEKAVSLWRNVDTSHGQLDARQWWYDHIGKPEESERLRNAIALLKKSQGSPRPERSVGL
jgi:O-antigen ligase